ncbi:MAG: VCBS repeat-containing protein [Gammaproteobacteria bacterium]|nr:VCBS repeat-containing protein [Gammaproteobacteria bacterium]
MVRYLPLIGVVMAFALSGGTCGPTPADLLPPTSEQEPNNEIATAQQIDLSSGTVRLTGTAPDSNDVDLFALGELQAGDRVTVTLSEAGTDAQVSIAIFRVQEDKEVGTLLGATTAGAAIGFGDIFQQVVHRTGQYQFGIERRFGNVEPGQNYDVTLLVEHGFPVPAAAKQIVMLQFGGGSFVAPDGNTVTVGAFDGGAISPGLAASTPDLRNAISGTIGVNFRGYNVEILRSDQNPAPAGQPFASLFFGPILSGQDSLASDGLGVAAFGVDTFNQSKSDVALVFSSFFTPAFFGLDSLSVEQAGTALGNVGSHEVGHLLGLHHAFDATDIMNTFDSPPTLLNEQRFKRSIVHFFVFDPLGTLLTQDSPGYLDTICGSTRRHPDLELATGSVPFGTTTEDFDGDGNLDLAVAEQGDATASIFVNTGGRSFEERIPLDTGGKPLDLVAFDTNFDGLVDIATANPASQAVSLLYLTFQGYTEAFPVSAGDRPRALVAEDFNGDFATDLAVANFDSDNVTILLNDGFGNFSVVATTAVGRSPQDIVVADFDTDGRFDLATSNFSDNTVTVLKGAGNGGFSTLATIPAGNLSFGLVAADFNNDNRVDLAVASNLSVLAAVQYGASVSVLINQGAGNFAPQAIYAVEPGAEGIAAADFNKDGWIDLVTANSGDTIVLEDAGSVSILLNRGNGTFMQDIVLEAGARPTHVAVGNFDGIGSPDIAVTNRAGGTVSIFFNE